MDTTAIKPHDLITIKVFVIEDDNNICQTLVECLE